VSEQEPPKIEFPCQDYPVKVLGRQHESFQLQVLEVFERHAPGFDRNRISVKASGKATFVSITVLIEATGVAQLQALHEDLRALDACKMVL
jgi:putative lipoic acid-binding regulatory protein